MATEIMRVYPGTPYRPAWEHNPSLNGQYAAPTDCWSTTGSNAWDNSNATYTDSTQRMVHKEQGEPDGGENAGPLGSDFNVAATTVADLPATADATAISSFGMRGAQVSSTGGTFGAQIRLYLRHRVTGAILVGVQTTDYPSDYVANDTPTELFSGGLFDLGYGSASRTAVLSALAAGNLSIEVSPIGPPPEDFEHHLTLRTFAAWIDVKVPASTTPPASGLDGGLPLRASYRPPSLRMLQRGGSGGMSGIPRMVGDPTRRGIRQGPGSIY